jgi:uncharacterized membrane protein
MNWVNAVIEGVTALADIARGAIEARRLDRQERARRIKEKLAKGTAKDEELRRKAGGK